MLDLLNKMSEALEGSRGDYGARYSYYPFPLNHKPRDKVLKISGINENDFYMAESFEAPKSPALKNLSTIAVLALAIFVGKKLKE